MTSLVFAVGGAMIGSTMGPNGAQWGWMLGSMLGGALDPGKLPDGPRLTDLTVQGSSYGQGIPWVRGTSRIPGNIIWSSGLQEHEHTESAGKGGPTQTTYTYTSSFAVSLCEGPITGVRRIWADGKLLYNISFDNEGLQSGFSTSGIAIYTGTEDQAADPTIQAYQGNTPAYRGQAYVVFTDLLLTSFGNRIPQLTFEVVVTGTEGVRGVDYLIYDPAYLGDYGYWGAVDTDSGLFWIPNPNAASVTVYNPITKQVVAQVTLPFATNRAVYNPIAKQMWLTGATGTYQFTIVSTLTRTVFWTSGVETYEQITFYNPAREVMVATTSYGSPDGMQEWRASDAQKIGGAIVPGIDYCWHAPVYVDSMTVDSSKKYFVNTAFGFRVFDATRNLLLAEFSQYQGSVIGTSPLAYDPVRRRVLAIINQSDRYRLVDVDTLVETQGTLTFPPAYPANTMYDLIYCAYTDQYLYTGAAVDGYLAFNAETLAYEGVVLNDPQGASEGYCFLTLADYPDRLFFVSTGGLTRVLFGPTLEPGTTTVAEIVEDLSVAAGLSLSDVDTTELPDVCRGFVVARQSSIRGAIEQLMLTYQFDAVESEGKVKFIKRGARSSMTFDLDDLSARAAGGSMRPPVALTRMDEVELPRSISIKYSNPESDYQISVQSAQRHSVNTSNDVSYELPVVMTDAEAKRAADALLYSAWVARTQAQWTATMDYVELEPTDVATLDGNLVRIRKITLRDGYLEFEGEFDSPSVIIGGALAPSAPVIAQAIEPISQTALIFMDIPVVFGNEDHVGFYVAACGYGSNWSGCLLLKSSDGGATYEEAATITQAATIGAAADVLGAFDQNIFDEFNTVTVRLLSGSLSSASELSVLNGANLALLGAEILQFKTATLNPDDTYTLSGLLRGREGTVTSGHLVGETFVVLNSATLTRVSTTQAEIDAERLYKAVSLGKTYDSASAVTFTNTGHSLDCLAPVLLGGGRDAAGNITINWTRRTRVDGGWRDGVDAPLGETAESYEVDVYASGAYATLKRTLTSSTPTVAYTAAQQTTDFGGTQATIYVKVYQLSATMGRGAALTGSV